MINYNSEEFQMFEINTQNQNIIKGSQRTDGTFRKDIKIREGFVNLFETDKYKIPQRRFLYDTQFLMKQCKIEESYFKQQQDNYEIFSITMKRGENGQQYEENKLQRPLQGQIEGEQQQKQQMWRDQNNNPSGGFKNQQFQNKKNVNDVNQTNYQQYDKQKFQNFTQRSNQNQFPELFDSSENKKYNNYQKKSNSQNANNDNNLRQMNQNFNKSHQQYYYQSNRNQAQYINKKQKEFIKQIQNGNLQLQQQSNNDQIYKNSNNDNLNQAQNSNYTNEKEQKNKRNKYRDVVYQEQKQQDVIELQPEFIEKVIQTDEINNMFEKLNIQE